MFSWLNRDIWGPIWPNLAASVIAFSAAWLVAHRYLLKRWRERERVSLEHHEETHRLLHTLHERIERLEGEQ